MASIEPVQWRRHFRSLLQNHTPDGTDKQFSDNICASLSTLEGVSIANEELNKPISLEELTGVIKDLKSGKASILDNISNGVIKCGRLSLSQPIMHLFNTTLKEGGVPNDWSDGLIIPIHKKGDRLIANNYRGIIISSCMGKIFIKMLTRRIDQHMRARELWKMNQCGYKPDHRTEDNLFILKALHEKYCVAVNKNVYAAFVDFLFNKLFWFNKQEISILQTYEIRDHWKYIQNT